MPWRFSVWSTPSSEPLAAMFGGGFASSSDGQFFRAGGFGRDASSINAHYGDEPGVKFYTGPLHESALSVRHLGRTMNVRA
jgi:TnpA family transposase